jgi:hypothetical protein
MEDATAKLVRHLIEVLDMPVGDYQDCPGIVWPPFGRNERRHGVIVIDHVVLGAGRAGITSHDPAERAVIASWRV